MVSAALSRAATRQTTRALSRGLHSTSPAQGAGGYDYLHAKHMYNFRFKPASKVKAGLLMTGGVALGLGIPVFAVNFNQKKAGLI